MMTPQNRIVMRRRTVLPATVLSSQRDWRRWAVAYGMIVCVGIALYLLRLPQWQIDRIEVLGAVKIDPAVLREGVLHALSGSYIHFIPRSSYVLTQRDAVAARLKATFPKIATITVRKDFPDTLRIEIKERDFWGVYCALPPKDISAPPEDSTAVDVHPDTDATASIRAATRFPPPDSPEACVLIDGTGFAYEAAPVSTGAVLQKIYSDHTAASIGTEVVPPHLMDFIRRALTASEGATGSIATHWYVLADYPGEIRLRVSDGFAIYFNTDDNLAATFTALQTVLTEEIKNRRNQLDYIDLRFGNKVFYKYKN